MSSPRPSEHGTFIVPGAIAQRADVSASIHCVTRIAGEHIPPHLITQSRMMSLSQPFWRLVHLPEFYDLTNKHASPSDLSPSQLFFQSVHTRGSLMLTLIKQTIAIGRDATSQSRHRARRARSINGMHPFSPSHSLTFMMKGFFFSSASEHFDVITPLPKLF